MDADKDKDTIQHLKNVFLTGNCQVEVKYGTMVFDSKLVIISSNASPRQIALSCGEACEPIYRRFVDTCGSFHYYDREQYDTLNDYMYHCVDVIGLNVKSINYVKKFKPKINNYKF